MTHFWVRAEERPNEARVGLTPDGAAALIAKGFSVTVRGVPCAGDPHRDGYRAAGARVAPPGSWRDAPRATPSSSA